MEKRKIGSLWVSVVGLGCNNFGGRLDADRTDAVVSAALDAGINFFDTADIYGGTKSEEYLGKALVGKRDDIIIASKFGIKIDDERPGGAKPEYIKKAVEDSLRRLGTDRIDLYQLHRPDDSTPIEDTIGALNDLVVAGKVREIGCSNFTVAQMRAAEAASAEILGARFVSVQNHFSLMHREGENDVLPECAETGVGFLPFFPLANGLLTGKYRKGQTPPEGTRISGDRAKEVLADDNLDKVEALITFAEAHGHSLLELAFGWLLSHTAVSSVIAGATSVEQIQGNAGASGWILTPEEMAEVDKIIPAVV